MLSPVQQSSWAIKLIRYITRYGTIRVSMLLALLSLVVVLFGSLLLRILLNSSTDSLDFVVAIILTSLLAPGVMYLFVELVRQLEVSRKSYQDAVIELEKLRAEDEQRNDNFKDTITYLNQEIEKRRRAQLERESMLVYLEHELQDKSEKEQQAQRLSTLLRSIIDGSPDLIYYRNEEGQFVGCNRVAEEMTGLTEDELIGLTPHEVYDESLAQQVVASDNEVLSKDASITEELWLKFADGRRRYFEMRKVPFYDHDGERLGLLAFGRDITERKKSEMMIEQASKDKTAFIATISHELRTPLNGIVGLSRMLRDTKLDSEQYAWVSAIYASGITLGNIFNDIIDLDKLDRERLELSLKTLSLKDFTAELSSIIELLVADKGLLFECDILSELPEQVEVDGTRLRQILWNLLFNAVKFTQTGKVRFTLQASPPKAGRCEVIFNVEDTGVGIPEHELDKIFAMYYQVDQPVHQAVTGTGIGLAICKQLVDKMLGSIKVQSRVGKGSQFSVTLPLAVSTAPLQQQKLQVIGLSVLLVEDIELNVMVAKALLEKMEQKVEVAMTGKEALDKVQHNQYDLILLDIQLPDMNGFEVADTIAKQGWAKGVPIVALTANVIRARSEYLDKGMNEVIAKPIKKTRMIEVFNALFTEQAPIQTTTQESDTSVNSILDLEMLNMLLDNIGEDLLRTSLQVFRENMPEYLEILQDNLTAGEKEEVCSQAHKIKGAAGSVGLSRVRHFANLIQQGDHPAWWENVHEWTENLNTAFKQDFPKLNDWLNEQQKVEDWSI
jgi:two-component system aerobic respiration control sensor histidine kinase ArcB